MKTKNDYKNDYLQELLSIAIKIDEKLELSSQKTKRIQRLAALAKQGDRETDEYKALMSEFRNPTVISFDSEMAGIRHVVKKLRKYKQTPKTHETA